MWGKRKRKQWQSMTNSFLYYYLCLLEYNTQWCQFRKSFKYFLWVFWWRWWDSNPWLPPWKGGDLSTRLQRHITNILAPVVGLEPTTLWLTVTCSTDWAIREYKAMLKLLPLQHRLPTPFVGLQLYTVNIIICFQRISSDVNLFISKRIF